MTLSDALDFARVLAAFLAVFVALPWLASAPTGLRGPDPISRIQKLVIAFIRASVWTELAGLLLGRLRLCLPGAALGTYLLGLAGCAAWDRRSQLRTAVAGRGAMLLGLVRWLETAGARPKEILARRWRLKPASGIVVWITAVLLVTLVQRLSFPLSNMHFARMETYARAISLQVLTHGDQWPVDGSVALLAPVVFLSGLSAAETLRFSGPLFATLLVAAVAWTTSRWTRRAEAAILGCACAALWPLVGGHGMPAGEAPASGIAALYVVLALGLLRDWWQMSLASWLVAALVDWRFTKPVAALIACGAVGFLAAWMGRRLGRTVSNAVAGLLAAGFLGGMMFNLDGPQAAGPYQYEAAARVASRIAREFPRNDWMVISPTQELAAIYGQGWHLELLEFTSAFRPEQVSQTSFSFPYPVRHLFIFVEKQPLWPGGGEESQRRLGWLQPSPAADPAVWAYGSALGRATLQYEAAELMAAYCRTHPGTKVYYEDARMVIYHLERPGAGET